jgi:hypothetical protein
VCLVIGGKSMTGGEFVVLGRAGLEILARRRDARAAVFRSCL